MSWAILAAAYLAIGTYVAGLVLGHALRERPALPLLDCASIVIVVPFIWLPMLAFTLLMRGRPW